MRRSMRTGWFIAGLLATCPVAVAIAADAGNTNVDEGGKVANYSLLQFEYGSPKFESLALWTGKDGTTRVDYSYGADASEVHLQQAGHTADGTGFTVRFANGYTLDVTPQGKQLLVTDRDGRYRKTFDWMYEGPVDGRGTFCTPCIDEDQAPTFVRQHFLAR